MIRRPPRSTRVRSSAASDVYKRQDADQSKARTMEESGAVRGDVLLRDVREDDLATFFEQQLDPVATAMADFPARERDAFIAHWRKILGDDTVATRTVLHDGLVAGNIVSFGEPGARQVGYWLGRRYWVRGCL